MVCNICDPDGIYPQLVREYIQMLYVIMMVVWVVISIMLKIHNSSSWFIVLIPLMVFGIGYYSTNHIHESIEYHMFTSSYLPLGLTLSLSLFTWIHGKFKGNKDHFMFIILIALILSFIPLIDIWIPTKWESLYKHWKSCLQTMSVTLFIYAILEYALIQHM